MKCPVATLNLVTTGRYKKPEGRGVVGKREAKKEKDKKA